MNSWKIIIAAVLIFGAGVVTGGLLANHLNQSSPRRARPAAEALTNSLPQTVANAAKRTNGPPMPDQKRVDFLRKISGELNLSAEQKEHFEMILGESQDRLKKQWSAKMHEEMNLTCDKIHAELTPQQWQKFQELTHRPKKSDDKRTEVPVGKGQTNVVAPLGTSEAPK